MTTTTTTRTITATVPAIAGMHTELALISRWRARGIGLSAVLWLVACLLLAQHAGLMHRIVHGGLLNAPPAAAAAIAQTAQPDADPTDTAHAESFSLKLGLHSCVLFDGATLADTHPGGVTLPLLAFGKPVKPANLAWRWPDLPAAQPFHSRAPPAAFAFA
ncbi:hypothetical protein [Cupriavidus pauculus]|uniref:hypothetical protein n=2 Tax=Cupriavidus pauculus TaxID=82633 RepID=UPI0030FBF6A9